MSKKIIFDVSCYSLYRAGYAKRQILDILSRYSKEFGDLPEKTRYYKLRNILEDRLKRGTIKVPEDKFGFIFAEDGTSKRPNVKPKGDKRSDEYYCKGIENVESIEVLKNISEPQVVSVKGNKIGKNKDGQEYYNNVIAVPKGQELTPKGILSANNLNPADWEIVSYTINNWQAQGAESKVVDLYQTKITVKQKNPNQRWMDMIDKFIDDNNLREYGRSVPIRAVECEDGGKVLEINIADLHIGLFGNSAECGENYNIEIAKTALMQCLSQIRKETLGFKFKKVVITTLGDWIHVDSAKQCTTNGTFQQIDTSFNNIASEAMDLMISALKFVKSWGYPTEYIYVRGNHDQDSGGLIALTVAKICDEANFGIECDCSHNPIKGRKYGVTAVLYHHGDAAKQNLGKAFSKFPKLYGATKYHKMKVGHLHHYEVVPSGDNLIYYMPSLCASSYWENLKLFESPKGLGYSIYDLKTGSSIDGVVTPDEKLYEGEKLENYFDNDLYSEEYDYIESEDSDWN